MALHSPQVDLAVKFLNNPRVAGSPLETKQAFLKKKGTYSPVASYLQKSQLTGLTDDELSEAIQQAQRQAPPQPPSLTSAPLPPPPPPPPRTRSWQEYTLIVAVAGGLGYALVRLIKVAQEDVDYSGFAYRLRFVPQEIRTAVVAGQQ